MKTRDPKALRRARVGAVVGLGLVLALAGCGMDEVEVPDLIGPSELGLSVKMTATPDILVADGFSSSLIRATVRDNNGRLVAGRAIFFAVSAADGTFADLGELRSTSGSGVGTGIQVTTDGSGVAQLVYVSPPRTDATAHQKVLVSARPVGDDFNGEIYRTVGIELRSAEPRLFPPSPGNKGPDCNFVMEPVQGPYRRYQAILFQTTSSDTPPGYIVRYQWYFGDGTEGYAPDTAKVYQYAGSYSVTHVVTDNGGLQAACAVGVTILP